MKTTTEHKRKYRGILILTTVLIISSLTNTYAGENNEPAKQISDNVIVHEQEIEIEPWMKDLKYCHARYANNADLNHEEFIRFNPAHFRFYSNEDSIRLESWMLSPNDSFWTNNEKANEDPIALEDWMLDYTTWFD